MALSYLFGPGSFYTLSPKYPGYARVTGWYLPCTVYQRRPTIVRKWLCILPVLLLAGCSRTKTPWPTAEVGAGTNAATESAPAGGSAPRGSAGVIPSGTPLHVRVDEAIDTRRNRAGDQFSATLSEPIEVDGRTMVPEGTEFSGHVTTARRSRRARTAAARGRASCAATPASAPRSRAPGRARATAGIPSRRRSRARAAPRARRRPAPRRPHSPPRHRAGTCPRNRAPTACRPSAWPRETRTH